MKQVFLRYLALIVRYFSNLDRVQTVFYAFVLFATIIIYTAFKYSVVEYGYYKNLADRQQTITVKNPVSRGTIYSNNDPVGVFATSTDLPDLAIDPQEVGSKDKLRTFLSDIVFEELCGGHLDDKCVESVYTYLKEDKPDDVIPTMEFIKAKISEEMKKRIEKKYVDFVLVKSGLTDEEMKTIEPLTGSGLFFVTNNLYANPVHIEAKDFLVAKLQSILNLTKEELDYRLEKRTVRYVKIIRKMNLNTKDKIDARVKNEKSAIQKGLLTEDDSISRFLIQESHPTRFYPEKNMGGQIVGFVDNANEGKYGIEGYFNEELKGSEGMRVAKKDISGRPIGAYDGSEKKMVNGADIKLTIDRNIQKEITQILKEGVKEFRANRGSVVVMDPKTGAIISMVSYPDFDPNNFGDVYEIEKVSYAKYPNPTFDLLGMPVFVEDSIEGGEFFLNGKKIMLRPANENEIGNPAIPKYKYKNNFGPGVYANDAVSALYEPGSVFKALTVAIGIDTGDIKPSDMYHDKGYVEIDNFKIKNVSNECLGFHTYVHALDWSCNVGMIDIVQKIGKSLFSKYIYDFGIGKKTNITLEGEVYGKLEPYEKWSRAKMFTMSFGQGITATVLQMAAAYSVLANGGVYMEPYVVDSITLADGTVIKNAPKPLRRVIKEETSKQIIAMLTEGAKVGFARKGSVDWYDVAGKTGTSQIASKGGYETGGAGHTITSYGWFAPASNPKYVMIVKIERPRSAEYSETTSSALFSRISKYLLNYYGIPKNGN